MSAQETIAVALRGRVGSLDLDAAFEVPAQGITTLIGPSGAGKTTLLRCIAGLTRLGGRVRVADALWQDERTFLRPHRRAVGYVFQQPSLLPHLSVRANLAFGLRRTRAPIRIGLEEVVALLGVERLLDRAPERLSGGEQQRVAIGRALLSQPELLLMDEPVSSLDPESKAEILPYLERLHQTLSIPVLYVSHDRAEVARLADRVLAMREGRVETVQVAEPTLEGLDEAEVRRLALAALRAGL
ncbi:MAG: molybdenum ABC transporter ATP-binding protein [Proteobacteria bacterium]|nr:molybdenum ABC transporter ATP-binding protein [Pseudomonadota bacterium]